MEKAKASNEPIPESEFLNRKSSITSQFADYDPKHLAALSVAAMIRTVAQMRNPRYGHDCQGRVKKINLDSSAEGYSNFMAPMRMIRISRQVESLPEDVSRDIYTDEILRPATETYLTAEWDEFVPFPNTWKIRFDGFGKSDYRKGNEPFGTLKQAKINVDALAAPPFYQPKGASSFGGSFADTGCVCNVQGRECHCKEAEKGKMEVKKTDHAANALKTQLPAHHEVSISKGCGVGN